MTDSTPGRVKPHSELSHGRAGPCRGAPEYPLGYDALDVDLATYVRGGPESPQGTKAGTAGGLLAYFAVGCPVCNKLALLALGYTGALQWFGPVQPVLGVLGIALLAWALRRRLQGEVSCSVRPS